MATTPMYTPDPNQFASGKNFPLSGAATDLGLGDQLKSQLEAADEERKKRLAGGRADATGLSPASMMLLATNGGFA